MSSYGGYVQRLARKVEARLTDIEAIYNFDLGDEFEIAICQLLTDVLPAKYGVCRGFAVAQDGETAGDDVIIYDRMQCPTLRSLEGHRFAVKDQVPVEAIYAYIECKFSIKSKDTFDKAMDQVRDVKSLLLRRPAFPNKDYESQISEDKVENELPKNYPRRRDRPYTAIFARNWDLTMFSPGSERPHPPDLIVLGSNHVMTQFINMAPKALRGALFYDEENWVKLTLEEVKGDAFGLGLLLLMQALSWMQLHPINWLDTVSDTFLEHMARRARGRSPSA